MPFPAVSVPFAVASVPFPAVSVPFAAASVPLAAPSAAFSVALSEISVALACILSEAFWDAFATSWLTLLKPLWISFVPLTAEAPDITAAPADIKAPPMLPWATLTAVLVMLAAILP